MDVTTIALNREKARELYRAYKTHRHYSEPIDWEVQRTYQLIAQGRVVIQALESIKQAGLNKRGLPKLAIGRATQKECWLSTSADGSAVMGDARWGASKSNKVSFPSGSFNFPITTTKEGWRSTPRGRAVLPLIPAHLRPRRGLANYHVLWEAEWEPVPPSDPYLLRRVGKADLWLVCAAWDLTPVERAAMSTRVHMATRVNAA